MSELADLQRVGSEVMRGGVTHLGSARVESDVVEQRLNLVLWNSWGCPNPGVPCIIQLPGRLSVQDHSRGHLPDDDALLLGLLCLNFPLSQAFPGESGLTRKHSQQDPPHQLFSTRALSYLRLGQKQLLDVVTCINSGRSRSMCPSLPHHCPSHRVCLASTWWWVALLMFEVGSKVQTEHRQRPDWTCGGRASTSSSSLPLPSARPLRLLAPP